VCLVYQVKTSCFFSTHHVLSHSEWLVGDSQTIADIAVAAQLGEVIRTSKKFGKEILDRPFIALWYKKQTG